MITNLSNPEKNGNLLSLIKNIYKSSIAMVVIQQCDCTECWWTVHLAMSKIGKFVSEFVSPLLSGIPTNYITLIDFKTKVLLEIEDNFITFKKDSVYKEALKY